MKGKTLDTDNLIIYNREYFQRRIFSDNPGQILTNEQHLTSITHLLRPPQQLYHPFTLNSTHTNNSALPQSIPESFNRNTYNNFSFNINLDREAMHPEEDSQND